MAEPVLAQKAPYEYKVEAGRTYVWCACGRSRSQPLCDKSHAGTGIVPIAYKAEKSGAVWFCGCKSSANKPLCDGTHNRL